MNIVITGGAGFIGHHLVEHFCKTTDHDILVIDRYPQRGRRLDEALALYGRWQRRVQYRQWDLREPAGIAWEDWPTKVDWALHLAAESHVDTSILDPVGTIYKNVIGTTHFLEWCRKRQVGKVLYFSTDEVFGPAPEGVRYQEWDRYKSGNPYAASKAAGEEIALAYANTYRLPVLISHCMNVFGERQDGEKFLPLVMRKLLAEEEILIHADPTCTVAGSRHYIHARNVASAVETIMRQGEVGDKYNIVGEVEMANDALARLVADHLRVPPRLRLVDFHSSRPGHDLRYALDGSRLQAMGWTPPRTFADSLQKTIDWTLAHRDWLQPGYGKG